MTSVGSIARDLRALGGSAPLRAVYEASKRSGFHSVLFRSRRGGSYRSTPIGLGTVVPTEEAARRRCLDDAAAILREGSRVFGTRAPTGFHAPWNVDPLTGKEWPQLEKWWRIDIRTDDRMSDVKWVWEAARHRDLVVLARAAVLEPDGAWVGELEAALKAWLDQCPPELGVNWYSSLELALRAIAWAQVLSLVGDELAPDVRSGMDAQLVASAHHILVELPYTLSSMKNNHLLGDGLGLVVIGRLFPDHPASGRWQRLGDAVFLKQLERHMHPDGSMIEDSLSYHRFVLEMLLVRALVGGADVRVEKALVSASEHLRQLGALDGDVPQFGDWDEGRVLADSAPAGDVAGAAWAGLALGGWLVEAVNWQRYDELAWYISHHVAGNGRELQPTPRIRQCGYFQVVERGPWKIWFKTGTGSSHQHADITSLWIMKNGAWVVREPGTGTYNGDLIVRNGFRTSVGHPVWRPVGGDQLGPHRAFRWLKTPKTSRAAPVETADGVAMSAWHDAFSESNGRVCRFVLVSEEGVAVRDFVERPGEGVMTIPLGPGARLTDFVGLHDATEHRGSADPFLGWESSTYGEWRPATWLEVPVPSEDFEWGVAILSDGVAAVTWSPDAVRVNWGKDRNHVMYSSRE